MLQDEKLELNFTGSNPFIHASVIKRC